MAKALFGHLATDPRLVDELVRLRRRVHELEAEVARLTEPADDATALLDLDSRTEPALT